MTSVVKEGMHHESFCFRKLTFDYSKDNELEGPRLETEKPVRGL